VEGLYAENAHREGESEEELLRRAVEGLYAENANKEVEATWENWNI
jgi:hypothetical protein